MHIYNPFQLKQMIHDGEYTRGVTIIKAFVISRKPKAGPLKGYLGLWLSYATNFNPLVPKVI